MTVVRLMLVLAILGSGACGDSPLEGELHIDAGNGRMFEYSPAECFNGDYRGYFGVELRDGADRILEFYRDGERPRAAFYSPADAAFELGPDDCERLTGELHRGDVVWGDVQIDCEAPNGWTLWGSLSFGKCGLPEEKECDDDF